jgi:hypothetical protein
MKYTGITTTQGLRLFPAQAWPLKPGENPALLPGFLEGMIIMYHHST